MRSYIPCLVVLVAISGSSSFATTQGYYRFPTIHDNQIVFNCEADLWKVPASGGLATRLTSHPANETLPRFSPDGRGIAFTGDYQSSGDVYVIPADGGEPKRLTFHPARDEVVGWTPDGSAILFRSRRSGRFSEETLFKISPNGGEAEIVKIGPASQASFSDNGRQIAFNKHSWMGTWKRYRGGTAPDVWVGDLAQNKFWQLTKDHAVDQTPMWIGDRVYFLSERAGTVNIFSAQPDGSDVRQHTTHGDADVRFAATDGKKIVYVLNGDVWLYDVATGSTSRVDVQLPSDRIRQQPRVEDPSKTLESFELSDDGKRITLSSRGEIWTMGTKPGGRIISVTDNSSRTRERAPTWSPDGKKLALITDENGEQELAIYDAAGKDQHKILTKRAKGWLFAPVWSADSKWIASADMTGTLFLVNAETGEVKDVDQDKNWEITQYTFSPDGKWLAYRKVADNRMEMIWLYNVEDGRKATISNGLSSDYSPSFSPDGKLLFFLSNRSFNPYLSEFETDFIVTQTAKPCFVVLAKDGKSPLLPDELLDEDEDDDDSATKPSENDTDKDKKDKKKKELPQVKIDLEGIERRQVELPVEAGSYFNLTAADKRIFYVQRPLRGLAEDDDDGPPGGADQDRSNLRFFDLKKKKDESFVEKIASYNLSGDSKKLAYQKGKTIFVVDASAKVPEEIEEKVEIASLPLQVNTADEWRQIFAEAWRLQRDFYWADNMVGVDWPAMRARYEPLVARASTRGELNDIIGQLIGELGTSHTYVWGGDTSFKPPQPVSVGVLGADIEIDKATGLHRFARVYRPEVSETDIEAPLTQSHANVNDADYLLAINGHDLAANESVEERLANLAGVQVQLTVCSKPDKSDARDIQIETLDDDSELRYADWCRRNREYVDQKSGGKIGYMHLPDMGGAGLVKFVKGYYPQVNKEALLIDARDNGGGFVSQMMVQRLARKPIHFQSPRRGMTESYPDRTHLGYKCVLINEHAGSDGDIFPDSFRLLGLGPLIGVRTWGGVIGIRMDKGFVDNGISSQPEFAFWDVERGWSIENRGVDPDIEVIYRPEDYIAGKDPQLDRGIAELMARLQEKPIQKPQPPPFPDRSGKNNGRANANGR